MKANKTEIVSVRMRPALKMALEELRGKIGVPSNSMLLETLVYEYLVQKGTFWREAQAKARDAYKEAVIMEQAHLAGLAADESVSKVLRASVVEAAAAIKTAMDEGAAWDLIFRHAFLTDGGDPGAGDELEEDPAAE